MLELTWVFLGLVAGAATYVTLSTADDQRAIICGLIGAITWLLFAYAALSVEHVSTDGTVSIHRYPAMVAWGLMMAAPNFYVALTGPLEIIKNPRQLQEEVS